MVTQPKFTLIGGALCLDFINTVGGRVGDGHYRIVREKFRHTQDLNRWSELAGIRCAAPSTEVLERALVLREALYQICRSVLKESKPRPADLHILNRELSQARSHERLSFLGDAFALTLENAADRILWEVARSAADLFTSDKLALLRQCGGHECGWMFLDTSRNRSRQWCVMRICGNRMKARNFRQRLSNRQRPRVD